MELREILSRCDHTLLRVDATAAEIRALCDQGMRYGCASVCIPPCHVAGAKKYVGDRLRICTVIGFPNGYNTPAVKAFEAAEAIRNGADEVVYPERDIAEKLAIRHNAKNIFDFVEVTDDFAIFEIPILKKWAGKSISEIDVRKTYHINVLAIKKGGNLKVLPEANYVFDQSDHIIVIGKPADVFKLTNRT